MSTTIGGGAGGVGIDSFLPGETPKASLDFTEVIRPQRVRELYNPNPEAPVQFAYNAEVYTLPPADKLLQLRDPFTRRKMTWPKPGVLPLYDIRFSVRGQRFQILADELVEVACGRDGRSGQVGVLGVRPLFGDERDEDVMLEAAEAFGVRRDVEALDRTRTHENNVAAARANGDVPPRPTQQIMLDYDWLARRDLSRSLRFACEVCNLGFREEQEMLIHTLAHHKAHPAAAEAERALKLTGKGASKPVYTPPKGADMDAIAAGVAEGEKILSSAEEGSAGAESFNPGGPDEDEDNPQPGKGEDVAEPPPAEAAEVVAAGSPATVVDAPKNKKGKSR